MNERVEFLKNTLMKAAEDGAQLDKVLVELVFDPEHSRDMDLKSLIEYLHDRAERLSIEDTPEITLMLDELTAYYYSLKENDDMSYDLELLADSFSKGLAVLEETSSGSDDERELFSWKADAQSFLAGMGVAVFGALIVSALKRNRK